MSKCIYCKDREITNGIYFCDKCKKDIEKIGCITGNVISDWIVKSYWYLEKSNGNYWKNDNEITMEDEREFQFIRPIDYIRFINYRNAIGEKEDSFAMSAENMNEMERWYLSLADKYAKEKESEEEE